VIADVNADANADLVMVTNDGNDVATLVATGDGTFTPPPVTSSTNLLPTGACAGHFFGTAAVDLITSSNNDGTISVLQGQGDGRFTDIGNYPGGGPISPFVTTADLNGDAIPDLLLGNGYGQTFSVLFGLAADMGGPSGLFGAPTSYPVGNFVTSLALADFDGDGALDVAASLRLSYVAVFLGDSGGAGTFTLDGDYAAGRGATWVAAGDFDNDGKPDLVTANFADSTVSILLDNR
jgi:hypothetical protein